MPRFKSCHYNRSKSNSYRWCLPHGLASSSNNYSVEQTTYWNLKKGTKTTYVGHHQAQDDQDVCWFESIPPFFWKKSRFFLQKAQHKNEDSWDGNFLESLREAGIFCLHFFSLVGCGKRLRWSVGILCGGNSNIFGIFTPKIGEDEPIFTSIFFKWVEKTN